MADFDDPIVAAAPGASSGGFDDPVVASAAPAVDPSIPGTPQDRAAHAEFLQKNPTGEPQNPSFVNRVGSAVGSAFTAPINTGEKSIKEYAGGPAPFLNVPLGLATGAMDVVARPFEAAVRGGSAAAASAAEGLGLADPTGSRRLERDLNLGGQGALIELGKGDPVKAGMERAPRAAESKTGKAVTSAVRWFSGTDPAEADRASSLMREGYTVSPSFAKELPTLQRKLEYARIFGYDPTGASASKLAKNRAQQFLERMGYAPGKAQAAVSELEGASTPTMERAGAAIRTAAEERHAAGLDVTPEQQAARAQLDNEIKAAEGAGKQSGMIRQNIRESAIARLSRDRATSLAHADEMINDGWRALDSIRKSTPAGDLAADFPRRLEEMRQGTSRQHEEMYNEADRLSGGAVKDTRPAMEAIDAFMRDIPEDLQKNQPALIRVLGEIAKDGQATFGQLHWLRSNLRDAGYNPNLAPSFKKGPFAHMANVVDKLIYEEGDVVGGEAEHGWHGASELLKATDASYARNMAIYRDGIAQQMVDATKAGVPPDAAAISRALNTDLQGARRRELLSLGGEPLRQRVWSATVDDLIENSRALGTSGKDAGPATIDPKVFLREVERLDKTGALKDYAPGEAKNIVQLAQRLAQRRGSVGLEPATDGSFARALQKAADADTKLQELAKVDPSSMLLTEMAKADKRIAEIKKRYPQGTDADPLGSFLQPTRAAAAAAEELLDPNKTARLRTVVSHLGNDHPAIQMLREQAAERVVKPFLEQGSDSRTINPERALGEFSKLSPEAQEILFPGASKDAIPALAREIRTIIGSPTRTMPGFSAGAILSTPAPVRIPIMMATKALAWLYTRPALLNALAGDLSKGGEFAKGARARIGQVIDTFEAASLKAGALGAVNDTQARPSHDAPAQAVPPKMVPWHQRLRSGEPSQAPEWAKRMGAKPINYLLNDDPRAIDAGYREGETPNAKFIANPEANAPVPEFARPRQPQRT